MPGLVLNTAEAMKTREPLPPGEYHVTLTDVKLRDASGPDKFPMLILEFTVAEDEGEYAGKKAFRNLSASLAAVPFMVDAAIALGADPDDVVQPSVDMLEVFNGLRSQEVWITTSVRDYTRADGTSVEQTNVDKILAQPS